MLHTAWLSVLVKLAYLLGLAGGLARRAVQVFMGMYQSDTWEVRRAGAVADLNAAVLAAAVILLWTSRDVFNDAQNSLSRQAWLNQLSDKPVMACNTFGQGRFNGTLYKDFTFNCDPAAGSPQGDAKAHQFDIDIPTNPQGNVGQVLKILGAYNVCKAFSMAYRVERLGDNVQIFRHLGNESIATALAIVTNESLSRPKTARDNTYYLDKIVPVGACKSQPSDRSAQKKGRDNFLLSAGPCTDLPEEFPPNTTILRFLTMDSNVGLLLNYHCDSLGVDMCLSNSSVWQGLSVDGIGRMRGPDTFCPLQRTLRITWATHESYLCAEGFDVSQRDSFDTQKARVDGLKLIYKFAYFYPCLSYDELFGLYIALASVFVAVVLGTGVLLFTDIVCPLLKFGHESWRATLPPLPVLPASANAVSSESPGGGIKDQVHADGTAGAAERGFQVWQGKYFCKDIVEVVLRCTVSTVLGTILAVTCVLIPMLLLKHYNKGDCPHLDACTA